MTNTPTSLEEKKINNLKPSYENSTTLPTPSEATHRPGSEMTDVVHDEAVIKAQLIPS